MKLERLEEYVINHPESREVLSAIASRKRNRSGIDVSRLIRQLHASQTKLAVQDIMNMFSAMENAEVGKLETRKGGRIQFSTRENILSIAKGMLGMNVDTKPILAAKSLDDKPVQQNGVIVRAGKFEILVKNLQDAAELLKRII